jgi:hypothetical protein
MRTLPTILLFVTALLGACTPSPVNGVHLPKGAILRIDSIHVVLPEDNKTDFFHSSLIAYARLNNTSTTLRSLALPTRCPAYRAAEQRPAADSLLRLYLTLPHSSSRLSLQSLSCEQVVLQPGQAVLPWLEADQLGLARYYYGKKDAYRSLKQLEAAAEITVVYRRDDKAGLLDSVTIHYRKP